MISVHVSVVTKSCETIFTGGLPSLVVPSPNICCVNCGSFACAPLFAVVVCSTFFQVRAPAVR
jgi:hypothetical protein